jgi:hypothetical protein
MFMAAAAFADSVRVTRDRATVWRADAPSVTLTVVPAGTILEVIETQGVWVKVRLPPNVGDPNVLGLILAASVESISGTSRPTGSAPSQPGRGSQPARGAQVRRPAEPFLLRGFGEVGYFRMTAKQSFNAIFDKEATWLPGGGVDAVWPNGGFGSAEVEWYRLNGERAFVLNDQIFPLGIEDVVTVIPISMTFGYQFGRSLLARPYAGAGFGVFVFRERADFAQSGDDVSENFASFHVTGGVDLMRRRRISTAAEARYTWVRDAIGKGGVSEGFNENDLGGFTIKLKVLFH